MSNKKTKSPYKDIIFVDNSKKELDKGPDLGDNSNIGETMSREFTPTLKAYVPYLNPELNLYEMFTVFIDPVSNETKIERRPLRDNNLGNSVLEMQKLYGQDHADLLKKLKKEMK